MENTLSIMRSAILEADAVAEFLRSLEFLTDSHSMGVYNPDGSADPIEPIKVEYKWSGMGPRLLITGRHRSENCICTPKVAGPVIANLKERFGEDMVEINSDLEISNMYL